MAQALLAILTSAHGALAYTLIFGVLLACGIGLPLPEDVALVTGGYLSFIGAVTLPLMLLVSFAGILLGDYLIFAAGRRYGNELAETRWIRRLVTDEKRMRCEAYFAVHGQGLIFAARFLPGLRAVTLWVADDGFRRAFADIEAWARECRFHDCAHDQEPGCAVQLAIARGDIDRARVSHYRDLDAELDRVAVQERDREREARAGRHPRRKPL